MRTLAHLTSSLPWDESPGRAGVRSPSSRAITSSAAIASSHATIPSGIGPIRPMPQPPRSSGVWCSGCSGRSSRCPLLRSRRARTAASRTGRSGSPRRSGAAWRRSATGPTRAGHDPARALDRVAAGAVEREQLCPFASEPRSTLDGGDRGAAEGGDVVDQRLDLRLGERRACAHRLCTRRGRAASVRSPGRSPPPARRRRAGSVRGRGFPGRSSRGRRRTRRETVRVPDATSFARRGRMSS